jgi:outer membrane lipase/esterase
MKIVGAGLCGAVVLGACLVPVGARAGTFYAFGDSLVDNGNTPKLTGGLDYPPAPYYKNRFSNGPVWAEYLPGLAGLGFVPSNDYGVGGAFAGPLDILGTTYNNLENLPTSLGEAGIPVELPSFLQEVQSFAATGQHFGAGDVVGVWVGANDYFATLALVEARLANPTTAFPAAIDTVATQTAEGVNELAGLGARRFIVFTLPNLGDTPAFNTSGAATIGLVNEISVAHGQALAQGMALEHYTTGANIILINEEQLFSELLADPAKYGKTNTTDACIDTPSCVFASTAAQNQYVFWDTVHPTTGTHLIIAEYAAAALQGVSGLTVPAQIAAFGANAFSSLLDGRMGGLQAGDTGFTVSLPSQGMVADLGANDATPQVGKLSGFFAGSYDYGSRKSAGADSGYSYNVGTFALGVDDLVAPGVALGAALGYGTDSGTVDGGGKVGANAYQLGAYATLFQPSFYMNFRFAYGFDGYNNSRPGAVGGDITAKPSGTTYDFGGELGFLFHAGQVTYGPMAGIDVARAHISAYTESGDAALTQSVEAQDFDRVVGDLGAQASTQVQLGPVVLQPKISAAMDDLFSGNGGNFDSVFTDEPIVPITSVYPKSTKVWGVVSGGVSAALSSQLTLAARFSTTFAKDDGEDHEVSANLRYLF